MFNPFEWLGNLFRTREEMSDLTPKPPFYPPSPIVEQMYDKPNNATVELLTYDNAGNRYEPVGYLEYGGKYMLDEYGQPLIDKNSRVSMVRHAAATAPKLPLTRSFVCNNMKEAHYPKGNCHITLSYSIRKAVYEGRQLLDLRFMSMRPFPSPNCIACLSSHCEELYLMLDEKGRECWQNGGA